MGMPKSMPKYFIKEKTQEIVSFFYYNYLYLYVFSTFMKGNIFIGRIKILPDDETVQCAAEKGEERNSERQGETVSENFK